MTIVVVAQSRDAHRQAEALRAALGLTLRGARVEVCVAAPLLTPLAQRAADTLRAFGYPVQVEFDDAQLSEALGRGDRVEVWT